jgi:hypothetical protein
MKIRKTTIFNGTVFEVPQGVQGIDHRATHGWQVRYGGGSGSTQLFSDHSKDGSGAAAALQAATKELLKRIANLPAPSSLQSKPSSHKTNGLPVGISGPVLRKRGANSGGDASPSVLVPVFGETSRRSTIYIGTEKTYTVERVEAALARAVALRTAAEQAYALAAARAKRAEARVLQLDLKPSVK